MLRSSASFETNGSVELAKPCTFDESFSSPANTTQNHSVRTGLCVHDTEGGARLRSAPSPRKVHHHHRGACELQPKFEEKPRAYGNVEPKSR